ncbi:TPA: ATP phosphoribosyltransferase regulatory subunit [Serratia marcescens]|uniref:Eco57I restriction-modification methylase domain-containing protein n=1 Tax=Serratia marcescens TaxID=615 RepID=UPI0013D8F872|nr:DNA methyltransferase [Serratia marcescens]ELH4245788.1 ATP phosphoribosyltransferase regulatory subunit [Serratia marcescens]HCR2982901.1 ATP phosphoribosyltransferase regulatory subunit [Serratia marcescens]HCR2988934.1 ATP phosphoribosyltransferase regulatory subunit [Serratia marcescens]HCR3012876.1 ATP phosphoribosyltransferase regulatory subunit [Serratia marcescens]HEJ8068977.1 ATP phosphoribosyltransferase regulatory subunit [Serratia marcescens]
MSMASIHDDWLSLIDISGPFLAVPVLKDAFPQGLEELDAAKRKRLRQAYDEWREALEQEDPQFSKLHFAWIEEVLSRGLEFDEDGKGDVLKGADWCAANLNTFLPDHGVALSPNLAIVDEQCANKPLMLIHSYAHDIDLDATLKIDGWAATPTDRMIQLCRSRECRLGLVTNGERWMLVDAPVGAVTSFASWYARLWNQEPITLQAFVHLLGIRRFFVNKSEQLPALFDSSLKYQDEVTDALGEQVRRAVEVLIQSLDKADQDRNRELLYNVKESELYEAALTVMMRLVFLLSAEERGLLLLGDERYEANYALSTLRMQLRKVPEEILERRWDAWSRLLAIFRAVFCGVEHESLRLPALGSSLFDPDHFPFLEGRAKDSSWRTDTAKPLPIDNRTVLLLLEAIQQFQGRTLSYRALDVEQIGYVYEGLLERTVRRTDEVTLELDATKKSQYPWVKLAELDSASMNSTEKLVELLNERSGSSVSRVRKDLAKDVDDSLADRLLTTCQGDIQLRDRIKPYAHLLRTDPWGYPLVYPAGAFIVTSGSNRRETGTHYTPKSLTEAIVTETLTPVAYVGPAEGTPRERWRLKSPTELLDLKICDPAMGSGAFLVQACRWLADRLVEAWMLAEASGKAVSVDGVVLDALDTFEQLPRDMDARIIIARRLIAERCLYGVDLNPLAVELAKLSIWLVTLAKGRPFGFLDHSLRCGDSLLGIHRLDQLKQLSMTPTNHCHLHLFGQNIERAVHEAIELRQQLREMPIRDIHDIEAMAQLNLKAKLKLEIPSLIADALVGEVLALGGNTNSLEDMVTSLAIHAGQSINGDRSATNTLYQRTESTLANEGKGKRSTFHWPLEFPEVFTRALPGFDAIAGNPPFLGNRLWRSAMGEKLQWQCQMILGASPGKIDLCVVFHRRAVDLLRKNGCYGLIATSNIAEGSAIEVGLRAIIKNGNIYSAKKGMPWPGKAAVIVAIVSFIKGKWQSECIVDGLKYPRIGPRLTPESADIWIPKKLHNAPFSFAGIDNSKGLAFLVTIDNPWFELLKNEPDSLLRPYITGDDITSSALNQTPRWALDIGDRSIEEIKKRWPTASHFLAKVVHPTRTPEALNSYKELQKQWWKFLRPRVNLMQRLRKKEIFIAYSKNTKYSIGMLAPSSWIYTNKVMLVGMERNDLYAISLSTGFRSWLEKFSGGNLGETLSLSISESVAKYPVPENEVSQTGIIAAARFNDLMVQFSAGHHCGLTDVMNSVNTPSNSDSTILELRELLCTIDNEVVAAYGWTDLEIIYDFREFCGGSVNDPWRWAPSEVVSAELITRLTALNQSTFEGL